MDIYIKAIKHIVRRLIARFPQLECQQDELQSVAGVGICRAKNCYDSSHPSGKSYLGWLIWAGEREALTALKSPVGGKFIGQHLLKVKRPDHINESDLLWKYPWLTLDIFPDNRNEEDPIAEEKMEFFLKALSTLSELEKRIFTRFYVDGLSYKDIVDKYSYSEKQIDNALIRSKSKIQAMIKTHPNMFPHIYGLFKSYLDGKSNLKYHKRRAFTSISY